MNEHPQQPLERDKEGVLRFKANAIVCFLLDAGPFDMNKLSLMPFSTEDRQQFAQLIGYSQDGYEELCYADSDSLVVGTVPINAADPMACRRCGGLNGRHAWKGCEG